MARVTLQIPDELHDHYELRATKRKRRVDRLIGDELKSLYPHDLARDRVLVIDPASRTRIEKLVGEGHLKDATDLADRLENLLTIKISGISLDFTPSQLRELAALAERNGCTPEDLVRATVKSMEELFFSHAYASASRAAEKRRVRPSKSSKPSKSSETPQQTAAS